MFYRTIKKIARPKYILLILMVSFAVFSIEIFLPNISLVKVILFSESIGSEKKISILLSLYGSIKTNYNVFSAIYTILVPILFGVNISLLLAYYTQNKNLGGGEVKVTAAGLVSSLFAMGCAACNTFLLSSVLSLFGLAGIIAFLPFGGQEFGVIATLLLAWSIYTISKKMDGPGLCQVEL